MKASASRDFWTYEDEVALYRIVPGACALEVYNQDVFVRHFSTWQLAIGGVVVSKEPLELNFSRNGKEWECPIWSRIRQVIETLVIRELAGARRLTGSQRKFLGIRFRSLAECAPDPRLWKGVKLLTDPSGKHLPLSELAQYTRFVHIPEGGPLACAAHGRAKTFVVTDALLDQFGMNSLGDWLSMLARTGLLPASYSIIGSEFFEHVDEAARHLIAEASSRDTRVRRAHRHLPVQIVE